jgi:hypothetical protein
MSNDEGNPNAQMARPMLVIPSEVEESRGDISSSHREVLRLCFALLRMTPFLFVIINLSFLRHWEFGIRHFHREFLLANLPRRH